MQSPRNIFTYQHTVTEDELDTLHHVNNVVYVQWIQDVSIKHWQDLTNNKPDPNYVWVVTRHEIDYKKDAILGDKITFKTWVGETKGVRSIRHVEIYREHVLLVRAQTVWCMLDVKTLRPTRITESVLKVLQGHK
ncbi:MAG: thioesterase family protein [Polaribacter sp.]|nr:thioesterase family protein [Polaribacter sp.]